MTKYNDIVKAGIGRVTLETKVDESFPSIGSTVELEAISKYAQNTEFNIRKSSSVTETIQRVNTTQDEKVNIAILGAGTLKQTIESSNSVFSKIGEHYIYAIEDQTEPYFDFAVSSEIVRTDETFGLTITPEMGYVFSVNTIPSVRIYAEGAITPLQTLTPTLDGTNLVLTGISITQRGYYDVEIDLTEDTITRTRRKNKFISITPRLAAKPTQQQIDNNEYTTIVIDAQYGLELRMYATGTNDLYCIFDLKSGNTSDDSGYYSSLKLGDIPSGKDAYTIVLTQTTVGRIPLRILLTGNTSHYETHDSGTSQFSFANPLVFTIDQATPLEIPGINYSTVGYSGNIRHTVWDGRGYSNISKGINFTRYAEDKFWEDAFMLLNGTSDVEIFECEISGTGFVPIMAKTDPKSDNPWFWKDNFVFDNFVWHHCYIHDTGGEGCYLGYFTSEQESTVYSGASITFKNVNNEDVTYINGQTYMKRAHEMRSLRLFRNHFKIMGYDGIQISNATNAEVCYNIIEQGSYKNDQNQTSGASIQALDGYIYNNIVKNHNGPAFQLGPYKLGFKFFNNICQTFKKTDAIQFLWSINSPDHNPSGGPDGSINNVTVIEVCNNVLISGRYTANGRNTVQVQKVYFKDNIMVNGGTNFASMTTETLALWEAQKKNNAIYTIEQFIAEQNIIRMADIYHYDFRIAPDSYMILGGCGEGFVMDFRGYKNWSETFPIGAYLGHYKADFVIPIESITITNPISIIYTTQQFNIALNPTNTTQTDVIWSTTGYESVATVDSNGLVTVISEGFAVLTVTSVDNPAIHDSITLECYPEYMDIIRVSFNDLNAEGQPVERNVFENGINIISYTAAGASRNLYNSQGTLIGTFYANDKVDALDVAHTTQLVVPPAFGFTSLQLKAWTFYAGTLGKKTHSFRGLPIGTYRVTVFVSNDFYERPCDNGAYYFLKSGPATVDLANGSIFPVTNNTHYIMQADITTYSSDGFSIEFGSNGDAGGYTKVPLNAMVIQRIY